MNPTVPEKYTARFSKYYRQIQPALERPKVRIYTTIVFSFLAISLFGWYAIRPTLQTIIYLQREIKDKTKLNEQMEQKIASLIEAQASYQEAQPLLALLDEAVPLLPDALDLTLQVRNITFSREATYSAISTSNIPLAAAEKKPGSKKVAGATNNFSESLTLNGQYVNLEGVITDIHSMRRLAELQSISFVPESRNSGTPSASQKLDLEMDSTVKSYYKK